MKYCNGYFLSLIFIGLLTSCSPVSNNNANITNTIPAESVFDVPTILPGNDLYPGEPTTTSIINMTPTPVLFEENPLSTITPEKKLGNSPTQTQISAPVIILPQENLNDCPRSITFNTTSILKKGNVLFTSNTLDDDIYNTFVFGISTNDLDPKILYQSSNTNINLSPDGKRLAWIDFTNNQSNLVDEDEYEIVVYDFAINEEMRFQWNDAWSIIDGWMDDHILKILEQREEIYGKGVFIRYVYLDTQTGSTSTETYILELPGFVIKQNDPRYGFYSINPTGQVLLYSANRIRINSDVILREISSGNILWNKNRVSGYVIPDWLKDGSQVVFSYYNEGEKNPRIVTITKDGQDTREWLITSEDDNDLYLRQVKMSPSGRYIYIAEWRSGNEGPAYIFDTETTRVMKICTPGFTFLTGQWLPEDHQFVYKIREGTEINQAGKIELKILDIKSWTEQTLAITENENRRINILGWTPLEFP